MDIHALHRQGITISEIARRTGHDRKTIRSYLRGDRVPGVRKPAAPDTFESFTDYVTARLIEDPHLWAVTLLDELHPLGFEGSYQSLTRHIRDRSLRPACLHSIIDGFSRLAYTEALEDEKAITTIGFFHRARVFFAAHGITRISRLVTDNGANYTSKAFSRWTCAFIGRHQRTRIYTPRHNGKIERYQRLMADECLYARAYDSEAERREAIGVWVHHYDYHRPHTACGDQPPASRLHTGVDNVMANYI